MKALPINIYRTRGRDCTNNGISGKYDTLLLVCERGYVDVDENNPPENLVKIATIRIGRDEFKHIEPVVSVSKGCVGWMSGGNIAYSSDSRFSELSEYPLCIHDRQETQAQYDAMFD